MHARRRPAPRLVLALVAVLAFALTSGCAGYARRTAAVRVGIDSNNAQAALDAADSLVLHAESGDSNYVDELPLFLLERGSLQQALANHRDAANDFVAADPELDMLDFATVNTAEIGRYLWSDSSVRYRTPIYERLMLYVSSVASFLADGDYSGARVEARRVAVLANYLEDSDRGDYPILGLAWYISGLAMELGGERDSAARYYLSAYRICDATGLPSSLARVANRTVRREFEAIYAQRNDGASPPNPARRATTSIHAARAATEPAQVEAADFGDADAVRETPLSGADYDYAAAEPNPATPTPPPPAPNESKRADSPSNRQRRAGHDAAAADEGPSPEALAASVDGAPQLPPSRVNVPPGRYPPPFPRELASDQSELVLIVFSGRAPRRVPRSDTFAAIVSYVRIGVHLSQEDFGRAAQAAAEGAMTRINYPALVVPQNNQASPVVVVNGQGIRVPTVANVESFAVGEFNAMRGSIMGAAIMRALVRIGTREGIQAVGRVAGDDSTSRAIATVVSWLTQIGMTAADVPDTRSWTSMPAYVHVARVVVEPGEHHILLPGGADPESTVINVRAGNSAVVTLRTFR